jgi:glycerophosphoryl diester phosphodiesterase
MKLTIRPTSLALLFLSVLFLSGTMATAAKKVVIAHRGLSSIYPENTKLAFQKALETSARFVELDVHLSKDNIPVVIHDDDLSRTTTGRGHVGDYTAQELGQISAGFPGKFQTQYVSETIPTLSDVLDIIMKGSDDKFLFLEVKHHKGDDAYNRRVGKVIYDSVMKTHSKYQNRFAFISFDLSILRDIRQLDKTVKLGPIFGSSTPNSLSLAGEAKKLGTDIVIFSKKLIDKRGGKLTGSDDVKHFIYTVLPDEFSLYQKVNGLYGFATDYAHLIN